jgi:hypothetical protein
MTKAEEYFNKLASEIPDVKLGKMFTALCMKLPNGKTGAMLWRENIVVKLKGEDHSKALKLKGASVFEPMEGRQMKEWVVIPYEEKDQWKKFATISSESVKNLPKKKSKKKKN